MRNIRKVQKEEGEWVEAQCGWCSYRWRPSFQELTEILYLIGQVEDEKYQKGKGADMVIEFCKDAIIEIPYEEIKKKYQLPK